ncbi:MAG: hypothetical protein ACLRIS_19535 [Flavonifractor plautii]
MRQRYDFGYFLSEGFHSIFTHGFMSFAAVCMIICCLLIMGSFTLVAVNAENMFSDLEAENQFTAYIDESSPRRRQSPPGRHRGGTQRGPGGIHDQGAGPRGV